MTNDSSNKKKETLLSQPVVTDDLSVKEYILKIQGWWTFLVSKWLIILFSCFIGGGLGLIYAILMKPYYVAIQTFVLEEEGRSGLGNLGGLAAMAGINLGNNAGSGAFQGDNILELYKSRTMLTNTLLSNTASNDSLLIERYINMNELRSDWLGDSELEKINFLIPKERFTLRHDSLIGVFVKNINENYLQVRKPDKMLSLIEVQMKTPNEKFSKDFTEMLVQQVNKFYIDTKTKKVLENFKVLKNQSDSVRNELNSAINDVAILIDFNPNYNSAKQILKAPVSRRQIDIQTNQAILTELVKNLELAKISLRRETPLIQIIDVPVLPLTEERVGKVKGIIFGGVILGFMSILTLIGINIYRDIMN